MSYRLPQDAARDVGICITRNQREVGYHSRHGYTLEQAGTLYDLDGVPPTLQKYSLVITCRRPECSITRDCCTPQNPEYRQRVENYRQWAKMIKSTLVAAGFRADEIREELAVRLDDQHNSQKLFIGLNDVPYYQLGATVQRIEQALGLSPDHRSIDSKEALPTRLRHPAFWNDRKWEMWQRIPGKELLPQPDDILQTEMAVLQPDARGLQGKRAFKRALEITCGRALEYPEQFALSHTAHRDRELDASFPNSRTVADKGVIITPPWLTAQGMSGPHKELYQEATQTFKYQLQQKLGDRIVLGNAYIVRDEAGNRIGSSQLGLCIEMQGGGLPENQARIVADALGVHVKPYGHATDRTSWATSLLSSLRRAHPVTTNSLAW